LVVSFIIVTPILDKRRCKAKSARYEHYRAGLFEASPRAGLVASRQTFVRRRHLAARSNPSKALGPSLVRNFCRHESTAAGGRGCGFAYLCTDDIDLAIEWLKQHGVLRGGISVQ
jgi:hypothetical protein